MTSRHDRSALCPKGVQSGPHAFRFPFGLRYTADNEQSGLGTGPSIDKSE